MERVIRRGLIKADCTAIHLRSCTGKRGFIVNSPVNADRSQNPVTSASK